MRFSELALGGLPRSSARSRDQAPCSRGADRDLREGRLYCRERLDSGIRIAGWIARSAGAASLNACAGSTRAGSSHPARNTQSRAKAPPEAAFAKGTMVSRAGSLLRGAVPRGKPDEPTDLDQFLRRLT